MGDAIATVLIAALLVDTAANVARLVGVEVAYKRQAKLMDRSEMESDKRLAAASRVIESTVKATMQTLYDATEPRPDAGKGE